MLDPQLIFLYSSPACPHQLVSAGLFGFGQANDPLGLISAVASQRRERWVRWRGLPPCGDQRMCVAAVRRRRARILQRR